MKCPACGKELVKLQTTTKTGDADFYACPTGSHYFIKIAETKAPK